MSKSTPFDLTLLVKNINFLKQKSSLTYDEFKARCGIDSSQVMMYMMIGKTQITITVIVHLVEWYKKNAPLEEQFSIEDLLFRNFELDGFFKSINVGKKDVDFIKQGALQKLLSNIVNQNDEMLGLMKGKEK